MKFVKVVIAIFVIIVLVNLIITILSVNNSPIVFLSGDNIENIENLWEIRGQIGDILSGHFAALAFFAVAFSIILQNESNKHMKKSIDKQEESLIQQSKALKIQSNSLEAQIRELQESRKGSKKQTEEFLLTILI